MKFYGPSEKEEKRKTWAFAVGASSPLPFACSRHTLTGAFQASPLVSACARARASLKFHPNVDVTRDD